MSNISSVMIDLAVPLATLAAKGTATAVFNKIKTIQDVKDADKLRTVYDEIVNELLSERDEAVRLAQAYKSELDKVSISDDDLKRLHDTFTGVLNLLGSLNADAQLENLEQIKNLISADTLKVIQLLGFNYKAAIGEPLTEICAEKMRSLGQRRQQGSVKNKPLHN